MTVKKIIFFILFFIFLFTGGLFAAPASPDFEEIKRQCIEENLFGAINPNREKRMCGYLLTRLRSMDDRLVEIFMKADITTQKLINLITVMNTNKLFFEFVYELEDII